MTDLKQHLPLILATLRKHCAEKSAPEEIRTHLRALLPASYGLGAGCLVSAQGERSQPFDIVIYDTTLTSTQTDEQSDVYSLRQTLAVIALARTPDSQALRDLLHAIASAKVLRSPAPQKSTSPQRTKDMSKAALPLKKLLPLGIVAFQQLLAPQVETAEKLALALDALLKEQEEE